MAEQLTIETVFEDTTVFEMYDAEINSFEMDCGLFATSIVDVSPESVAFWAVEKFGSGQSPYAPGGFEEHREMGAHEHCVGGEGAVEYAVDEEVRSLPKFLYFKQTIEFEQSVDSLGDLERELSKLFDLEFVL